MIWSEIFILIGRLTRNAHAGFQVGRLETRMGIACQACINYFCIN